MNTGRWVAGVFAVSPLGFLLANGPQPPKVQYATDVAPIFKAHCASCHAGKDAAAKLDLSVAANAIKGGISGKTVVPGKPEESLLIVRITGGGGKPQMPMGFQPLTKAQIDTIRTWIEQGANIAGADTVRHWAYIRPVRPSIPVVRQAKWIRNPIDAFVLAKLEASGLKPSPEASKETLIRRVSLDLTGLPPSPKEIDAFLADKRPDAYERLVDRLLASPHYGERQARPWLDLARYADSDGYEKDLNRTAWKYRDWVIDAFNRNEPYDKFTIDQLAGDLLPFKGYDQLVATGFNRNTMMNLEGGVDQAEAHFNVILDRVNTTSTVWLGSTIQCSRCHNHKYDPFTQKDYYKLAAYFSNSVILPRGSASVSEEKWFESEIPIPSGRQVAERIRLESEQKSIADQIAQIWESQTTDYEAWEASAGHMPAWTSLTPTLAKTESGAAATVQPDRSVLISGNNPAQDTYTVQGRLDLHAATAIRLEALPDPSLPNKGPGRASNFVLTGLSLKIGGKEVPLKDAVADFTQEGFDPTAPLRHDASSGWAIYPGNGKPHFLVVGFASPISNDGDQDVEVTLEHLSKYANHLLGRFRLSFTTDSQPLRAVLPANVQALISKHDRTPQDEATLKSAYESMSPAFQATRDRLKDVRKKLDELQNAIPTALIMRDKPAHGPLTANVHVRGEFLNTAEQVTAGTPAVFGPPDPQLPSNRLGLAEWIASKSNPLTARVQVNRIWEQYFGRGIVETSEDFGTQGARPSNQALLDWLATEFIARNWDMKAIHRLVVTSATYRQTSSATPELMKRDPQNILMARGPRFRMEAEMIRDTELAAAGLLNLKIGGPSVYPSQPNGVWDTPYNDEQWMTSKGHEGLRRGLYTFWKRSSPYPSFMAFDATSREECTVRRIRTNTPLQALALLNDQALFVAARALGKKMIDAGPSEDKRLTYGFRACTGRHPSPKEEARLEQLVAKLESRYAADPKDAKKIAPTPAEAAYTLAANVLLNLDETITKG
ncbi:MAG: PSD1 and planctomycete cytochrome C domain-containing protein [Fimbriimonas sp.]|nr:PSD1 and planctomycete cytochrome C domain-containing protein [Fimbriimonas sp.]